LRLLQLWKVIKLLFTYIACPPQVLHVYRYSGFFWIALLLCWRHFHALTRGWRSHWRGNARLNIILSICCIQSCHISVCCRLRLSYFQRSCYASCALNSCFLTSCWCRPAKILLDLVLNEYLFCVCCIHLLRYDDKILLLRLT